jgi:hypothetical protein
MNKEEKHILKAYAEQYQNPLSDFRGFKRMMKEQGYDFKFTKREVAEALGYIASEKKKVYV